MAHILVIDADADIRETLRVVLGDTRHFVTATPDLQLAAALLRTARCPLVVLLNERLWPLSGLNLLEMADGDTSRRLSHHGYAVMTTTPERLSDEEWALMRRVGAALLALPFDLDELLALVGRMEERIGRAPQCREAQGLASEEAMPPTHVRAEQRAVQQVAAVRSVR